jgi:hypothetical protein
MMVELSRGTFIRFIILLSIFLITWLFLRNNLQRSILNGGFLPKSVPTSSPSAKSIPTIARVLYLFLCENQDEMNAYLKAFPSITADVMVLCWRENCLDTNFSTLTTFYTIEWTGRILHHQPLVRLDSAFNYIMLKPRVFIINERQLNLTRKTTWTTGRNLLYERAIDEERQQGWRWAYFNFGDGDIQADCPLAEQLLKTNQTNGDELVFAPHFRSLINIQQSINIKFKTNQCFILIDTFLLSVSPAIGSIGGMMIPPLFDGLLAQIVYHVDAMFNAFHRDALPFVLPYCARYDDRSWWTSQAILIYRSLCLYGHAIQFNAVYITRQKHRAYPRHGNPWAIDNDMNLVPVSLIPLQTYMKHARIVSAVTLQHYTGWSLNATSSECRNRHTFVDPVTCKVSEKQNRTKLNNTDSRSK